MKIAMIIVRTLIGLLFVVSSLVYFLDLVQPPEMTGPIVDFNKGLAAATYFLPLLKWTELICGILLVIGRFVPFALVVLSPIVINIFMVHAFLEPSGLPVAIVLVLAFIFLGWYYRENFRGLFES